MPNIEEFILPNFSPPDIYERPPDYRRPTLSRLVWDGISNLKIHSNDKSVNIPEYYNRGDYRFVYLIDNGKRVLKIFKMCNPRNAYFGTFYDQEKRKINIFQAEEIYQPKTPIEKKTLITSLAINQLEKKTYEEAKKILPERIVETEFGLLKKSRFKEQTYFRPYSIQPLIEGTLLSEIIIERRKIRSEPIDGSQESLYRCKLDFSKVNKEEVLAGIKDFLDLFQHFYEKKDAVIALVPRNLIFSEDVGLVCFDLQKYHRGEYEWRLSQKGLPKKPRDIYFILAGMIEANS